MQQTITLLDGCTFTGQFEFGERNGYGKKTYPNGATFEGTYWDDMRHGQGVKTTALGEVKHVRYTYGVLI